MSSAPAIVRIAGLSGNTLKPFLGRDCLRHLEAREAIVRELTEVRDRLVDLISRALPGFSPPARRILLQIKRDSFNGRSLRRHRGRPEWAELLRISDGLAEGVLGLEERADEAGRTFAEVYQRELERERCHLLSALQDRSFLRGLALSSPELVTKAQELAASGDFGGGRKERKIEQTLLRFVTRAAVKLSPYSTLTSIALCTMRPEPDVPAFWFTDGQTREISLVRVNRALLDQCVEILLGHPALRDACRVAVNETVREMEPGHYRFLRGGHWSFDPERSSFRFVPAAHVNVRLSGPLLPSARRVLADGPMRYGALLAALVREHADGDPEARSGVGAGLDRLVSLGVLHLLPPWPTHETYLEKRLLDVLRTFPEDPALAGTTDALERLVELEEAHADQRRPEQSMAAIDEALGRLVGSVDRLSGRDEVRKLGRGLYEDVFLVPARSRPEEGELLQISSRRVEELIADAGLVWRYAYVYNHRHDLTHTLAAFWAERWPERREMAFLDLFQELSPLWTDYLRFDLTERYSNLSSFNPLGLPAIDRLNELRRALVERAQSLMRPSPHGMELPRDRFTALLDDVPLRYRPMLGPCLFVQPADPEGALWVLNRLFEGSGRYISRYGAIMEEPMRSRFADHLTARSVVEVDGEEADLLDLMFTSGSMVNLRRPQTAKVLQMPGERVDLPAERRVRLTDLQVHADLATESFRLTDGRGRRLLAVHLSSLNNVFLPVIIRLLSLFGPFETRQVFPRPPLESAGGAGISERLTCGRLVIRRKRWEIALDSVPDGMLEASGADAFERVQRWRRTAGLPARVFLYEQMHQGESEVQSFKPQYLDFGSPSLVSLFLAIARKNAERLVFEEPLPLFTELPSDGSGEPRAFELQIDSLALQKPDRKRDFLPVSHRS